MGNYEIEWSAFRVWRHPKRALDYIDNLEIMENDLQRQIERLQSEREALQTELSAERERTQHLESENCRLEGSLGERLSEIEALRRDLTDAREELRDQDEIDRQLEAFSKQLDKFIDLKNGYEKRIADLEKRLRSVQQDVRVSAPSNIDMNPLPPDVNIITPDSPGLKTRPDQSFPQRQRRHEPPSDDWLMDLPDNL